MSLTTEDLFETYEGNASTVNGYVIPFPFLSDSHIKVSVTSSAGVVTVLDPSEYTVDGAAALVYTGTAWADTYTVTVYRELPITQPTEFLPSGPFRPAAVEMEFDRGRMIDQQLNRILARCFKLADPGGTATDFQAEPNSLMGFDSLGNPTTVDQDEVRELAQLAGGDAGSPQATFADAAARAARVPDYVGQLGYQRDTGESYFSTATTAGSWIVRSNVIIVRTDAQLRAALLLGNNIGVLGTITGTTPFAITVRGTNVFGIPDTAGNLAKVIVSHAVGVQKFVFTVATRDWRIASLDISTSDPLTVPPVTFADDAARAAATPSVVGELGFQTDTSVIYYGTALTAGSWSVLPPDIGIELTGSAVTDCSFGVIENCHFHHLGYAIRRNGSTSSKLLSGLRIQNNDIRSIRDYGILINWRTSGLLIDNNDLLGVDSAAGDTHTNLGNGIWAGNFCDCATVSKNRITNFGRMGIEYWNSEIDPNGNQCGKILGNVIFDTGQFGISAFGNGGLIISENQITRAKGIGLELYGDSRNTAEIIAKSNIVLDTGALTGATVPSIGISIEQVYNGIVEGNIIGRVTSNAALDSIGLQIIHGARDLVVRGNRFKDAGSYGIYINGAPKAITAVAATDLITSAAHKLLAGNIVVFKTLTGGAGLTAGNRPYYVIADGLTENTFKVSTSLGGAAVNITTDVTAGTVTYLHQRIAIDQNVFTYTYDPLNVAGYAEFYPAPLTYWPAIRIQEVDVVSVHRNVAWIPSIYFTSFGLMQLTDGGTVYVGSSFEAPVVYPASELSGGSNTRIPY